jgi:DNA repair photolyase
MFREVATTWNVVTGCLHQCVYCWARRYAVRLAKMGVEPYTSNLFKPTFIPKRLDRKFRKGQLVFVSDVGDLFGSWVPAPWIQKVLETIGKWPETTFLLLTKNPERYLEFELPSNVIAGATVESNRQHPAISQAPSPEKRLEAMRRLAHDKKMISVEPILDFDLEAFVEAIRAVNPIFVYVGYDNYNFCLPEPKLEKTLKLIEELETFTEVRLKTIRKAWNEESSLRTRSWRPRIFSPLSSCQPPQPP